MACIRICLPSVASDDSANKTVSLKFVTIESLGWLEGKALSQTHTHFYTYLRFHSRTQLRTYATLARTRSPYLDPNRRGGNRCAHGPHATVSTKQQPLTHPNHHHLLGDDLKRSSVTIPLRTARRRTRQKKQASKLAVSCEEGFTHACDTAGAGENSHSGESSA